MSEKDHGLDLYQNLDRSGQRRDNSEELRRVYAKWAHRYDHDNDHDLGTVSQPTSVALLSRFLDNRNAEILDVGCGTGLVGTHLHNSGFQNFDGTDLSPEMLELAKSRHYRELKLANLNEGLPWQDESYDGVLCVGVFTHGHVLPSAMDELIRVTKPNGLMCFTVNEGVYETDGFVEKISALQNQQLWTALLVEKAPYMTAKGVEAWYHVMQKPQ